MTGLYRPPVPEATLKLASKGGIVQVLQGFLVVLVSLTAIAALAGFILQSQRVTNDEAKLKSTVDCMQTWANEASLRTTTLSTTTKAEQDALYNLLHTLTLPPGELQKAFHRALFDPTTGYLATHIANADASLKHPAPTFNC